MERKHAPAILSSKITAPMVEAGLIPPNCNRVIIDLPAGGVVGMYYSVFADERLIELLPEMIKKLPIAQSLQDAQQALISAAEIAIKENKALRAACKGHAIDIRSYGVADV